MMYLGGKTNTSKPISEIINKTITDNNCDTFVSLFCGSCSIESKVVVENKICNDKHEYLIDLWKGLQNCFVPPDTMTREKYYYIKANKDENRPLTGFTGFGCSFGGKWFGGYVNTNKRGDRCYCTQSKNSLMKKFEGLKYTTFTNEDYLSYNIEGGVIVYCDPPYKNTTGYTTGEFNHEEFWCWCDKISESNIVFISEQEAPENYVTVWERKVKRTTAYQKNVFSKTEKLFVNKKWKEQIERVT